MHVARRIQLALVILAALSLGGLIGVGVAQEWYPPAVGVSAAGILGIAAGLFAFKLIRRDRQSG